MTKRIYCSLDSFESAEQAARSVRRRYSMISGISICPLSKDSREPERNTSAVFPFLAGSPASAAAFYPAEALNETSEEITPELSENTETVLSFECSDLDCNEIMYTLRSLGARDISAV